MKYGTTIMFTGHSGAASFLAGSNLELVDREDLQVDLDAEFGGPEARKQLERKKLWKLDLRISIPVVVIYILNFVSGLVSSFWFISHFLLLYRI